MDNRRFDELAKRLGGSRRRFLKQVIGLGGAAAVATLGAEGTDAARRGYAGPRGLPPQEEPFHICFPLSPHCCIDCSLNPTYYYEVELRFFLCLLDGNGCASCASSAAKSWEGTCHLA